MCFNKVFEYNVFKKRQKYFLALHTCRNRTFCWDFVRSGFAESLEKLALKQSSNNKVFKAYPREVYERLETGFA